MNGTIFISYRRGEDSGAAGRLYDRLERTFGPERLFMDVDNIPPGEDFVRVLEGQVAACDVLLALIGRGWLTATDDTGQQRLNNPDDFVRIEIASGLAQGKRVIPVLVNDAKMPRAGELPEELTGLARRQAVRIVHDRFRDDAERLARTLEKVLGEAEARRKTDEEERQRREKEEAEARRKAEEEERERRQQEEAEARRKADEEERQRRQQEEAETRRKAAEEERQRQEKEEAEARRKADEEERQRREKEEAEAKARQAVEEQKRDAQQRGEQDEARRAAEADAARMSKVARYSDTSGRRLSNLIAAGALVILVGAAGVFFWQSDFLLVGQEEQRLWPPDERPPPAETAGRGEEKPVVAAPAPAPPPAETAGRGEEKPVVAAPAPAPAPAPTRRTLKPLDTFRDCAECPEMVVIPAGPFMMGSPANEPERDEDEGSQRRVSVGPFAIGKTEVTFAQWNACVTAGGCNGYKPPDQG